MRAQTDRLEDKRYLRELSETLEISYQRIKLDECGDWNIYGRKGKIFTDTEAWYVYFCCSSKRSWSNLKARLKFMEVSQDGDEEGVLNLLRMPFKNEVEKLRKEVGLRKRTILTKEQRAELIIRFKSSSS